MNAFEITDCCLTDNSNVQSFCVRPVKLRVFEVSETENLRQKMGCLAPTPQKCLERTETLDLSSIKVFSIRFLELDSTMAPMRAIQP